MTEIQVLIADDHDIVRTGLRALIESTPDMVLVAEAAGGVLAVAEARRLEPDVAVLDLEMPHGGIKAAQEIRECCASTKVLILTMHDDRAFVRAALDAGSSGYVVKEALGTELLTAIRAVHQGRSYINVTDLGAAVGALETTSGSGDPKELLSARELEVLILLAYGHTNREIGDELHLSHRTVATYRTRLSQKLDLNTRADVVRYALRHGLLRDEATS